MSPERENTNKDLPIFPKYQSKQNNLTLSGNLRPYKGKQEFYLVIGDIS